MSETVTMTCMSLKKNFDVVDPPVTVLSNGRYAYRVMCPWKGKDGKDLYAFKFCSANAHQNFLKRNGNHSDDTAVQESSSVSE